MCLLKWSLRVLKQESSPVGEQHIQLRSVSGYIALCALLMVCLSKILNLLISEQHGGFGLKYLPLKKSGNNLWMHVKWNNKVKQKVWRKVWKTSLLDSANPYKWPKWVDHRLTQSFFLVILSVWVCYYHAVTNSPEISTNFLVFVILLF